MLLVHIAATWSMVGLIWFVQLVHYPLFAKVGESGFVAYEHSHKRRTSVAVGLFMPVEAATAVWLLADVPTGVSGWLAGSGFALVVLLWLSTAFWQAPLHGRLSAGYSQSLQRKLVSSNWVRTVGWSARGVIVLAMAGQVIG